MNKGNIVKVEIIGQDETHKIVKVIYNGEKKRISNKSIYETKNEAKLAIKEIKIKRDFKKKYSNKNGLQICKGCGCIGTHTLDHKKPLIDFGGRENIRKNEEIWKLAWKNSNLQILCKKCNEFKSDGSNNSFKKDINAITRRGNYLRQRKNKLMSKGSYQGGKVGYGISTSRYNKMANNRMESENYIRVQMEMARADSRVLFSL